MRSVLIFGRQPELGLAEIESLYGHDNVSRFGNFAASLNIDDKEIDFDRLGGSIRLGKIIEELQTTDWKKIEKHLLDKAPDLVKDIDGKINFGISTFSLKVDEKVISRTALQIKKIIKNSGKSVRMVPHSKTELGSATVLYNKLASDNGWEFLLISDGKKTLLARTVKIQNIDAYSSRDQARPFRDAKVGMLPPKLAQIIINLAVGQVSKWGVVSNKLSNSSSQLQTTKPQTLILDAFCGTGVVLQEAMLMDYDIYGTDIEPRMVQYTIDNLKWLDTKYPHVGDYRRVEIGDATTHKWEITNPKLQNTKLVVAGETYLGQPLSALPSNEHLSKIIYEVNLLHHKFLENIGKQIPSGTRLCLAIPTWRGNREFLHLPTLDYLGDLGYTRMRFKHVGNEELIYHRENQVVGRELLVLEKR